MSGFYRDCQALRCLTVYFILMQRSPAAQQTVPMPPVQPVRKTSRLPGASAIPQMSAPRKINMDFHFSPFRLDRKDVLMYNRSIKLDCRLQSAWPSPPDGDAFGGGFFMLVYAGRVPHPTHILRSHRPNMYEDRIHVRHAFHIPPQRGSGALSRDTQIPFRPSYRLRIYGM